MSDRTSVHPDADDMRAARLIWDYLCLYETPRPIDGIIGLCEGDAAVADWCAELYCSGFAPVILFAGKQSDDASGPRTCALRAQAAGVPVGAILVDENSSTPDSALLHASAALRTARKVLLATRPHRQRLAQCTAGGRLKKVTTIVSAPLQDFEFYPGTEESAKLVRELVSEIRQLNRLASLEKRTFVPGEIELAYWHLAGRGFVDPEKA